MLKNLKQFRSLLYIKFLGVLIKKVKKLKAKRILDTALSNVIKKLKIPANFILYYIFKKLNTFVEARQIKKRKKITTVPFPISFSRRIYLALK